MTMTDEQKKPIFDKISAYVQRQLPNLGIAWNPSARPGNSTEGFSRYKYVELNVRLTETKYEPGELQGVESARRISDVDIHLYLKRPKKPDDGYERLAQRLKAKQDIFKDAVKGKAWCEWGGNDGALVKFHVPVKWEDWDRLDESERRKVSDVYGAVAGILAKEKEYLGKVVGDRGGRRSGILSGTDDETVFFERNMIVFGAPGTGKSNFIEGLRKQTNREVFQSGDEVNADEMFFRFYERVTFYPTYSYSQFVGAYKPVMDSVDKDGFHIDDSHARKVIAYKFIPGPLLRILTKALKDQQHNYLLVVEEINRANAAAVFGDVFQLLDRRSDDGTLDNGTGIEAGWSEYSISPSEEIKDYLIENDLGQYKDELRMPKNLYVWATMNSADQGVFPLDTAFKRRWEFEYLSLDDKSSGNRTQDKTKVAFSDCSCTWGQLRKAINHLLARNRVNEDKLLSAFFMKGSDGVITSRRFKSKVLMYLWEDAARMCRMNVFSDDIHTLSDLFSRWDLIKHIEDATGRDILSGVFKFDDSSDERVVFEKAETQPLPDAVDVAGAHDQANGQENVRADADNGQAVVETAPTEADAEPTEGGRQDDASIEDGQV